MALDPVDSKPFNFPGTALEWGVEVELAPEGAILFSFPSLPFKENSSRKYDQRKEGKENDDSPASVQLGISPGGFWFWQVTPSISLSLLSM